ncbi:MAG: hypothetical protein SGPRY_006912, partial [Prymnesium sp.]
MGGCSPPPFDSLEQTKKSCYTTSQIVVKEIRLVGQLHTLVSRLTSIATRMKPITVIQLVRDPRAVLASQKRLHWHGLRENNSSYAKVIIRRVAKRVCRGMLADSRTGRRMNRRPGF